MRQRHRRPRRAPRPPAPVVTEVVQIDRLAAGGDGVSRAADGRALFVPRTAPGDVVEVAYATVDGARFARARVTRRLRDGADRVEAPCAHYRDDACGGCQLQHLSIEAQRTAKAQLVVDAFARIAKREIPRPIVVPSPSQWQYRRKATFAIRAGGGGFHAVDDPDRLISITECAITDAQVLATLMAVREARAWLPPDGEWRAAARLLDGGGVGVTIEGGQSGQWTRLPEFTGALPDVSAIWWRPRDATRAVLVLDRRPSTVVDAAPAFAQVNAPLAAQLAADVVRLVREVSPTHVVDAYAGSAPLARALAAAGIRATAIEVDADACEMARHDAPSSLRVIHGPVERELPRALPADVIVVNPPRTGLAPEVPAALNEATRTRLLLYVSCDPATLARDVARLSNWRLKTVRCYDLFPQTAHVESVVELHPVEDVT
jgi:23S rRNA (uracil1939-C5)-methyltransferase